MDTVGTDIGSPSLADYGARLRRRWWIVALGVIVGLAAGLAYYLAQPPQYTSQTSVLVLPIPDPDGAGQGQRGRELNLDTEAQIVQSAKVAEAAQSSLGNTLSPSELLRRVAVTVPPNSQVLTIAFTDRTPESAQAGARAFAENYLEERRSEAETEVADQVEALTDQLGSLQAQLNAAADSTAVLPPDSPSGVLAGAQRAILIDQITSLTSRLSPLRALAVTPGTVITEATMPGGPVAPVLSLDLGAGAMLGLLLGLLAAVVADRADHRVRRPQDVARYADLPLLADLGPRRGSERLTTAAAFDLVRSNAVGDGSMTRLVQVQDVGTPVAADTCALELARSVARNRGRAILVVGHPGSGLPETLGLPGARGLADVLRGQVHLTDVLVEDADATGLQVLLPGRDPESVPALLQSPRLSDLLSELRTSAPCVVVETEAADRSAAARVVAARSDTVLMSATAGVTDGARLAGSALTVTRAGVPVAGVVLGQPSGGVRGGARTAGATQAPADRAVNPSPR